MDKTVEIEKKFDLNYYLRDTKRKSFFVIAVTVVFLLVFMFLGVLPAFTAVFEQAHENKTRDEAISLLTDKIATLKTLDTQATEQSEDVDYLNKVSPTGIDQVNLITYLYSIADTSDVFINNVNFASEVNKKPLDQSFLVAGNVDYENAFITVEGSRDNLVNFVKNLEDSRMIFNVTQVNIFKKFDVEILSSASGADHGMNINVQYFYTSTETTTSSN